MENIQVYFVLFNCKVQSTGVQQFEVSLYCR